MKMAFSLLSIHANIYVSKRGGFSSWNSSILIFNKAFVVDSPGQDYATVPQLSAFIQGRNLCTVSHPEYPLKEPEL